MISRRTVCPLEKIDLREVATRKTPRIPKDRATPLIRIKQYHPDLPPFLRSAPTISVVASSWESSNNPFFHGSCIFDPESEELYISSDLLPTTNSSKQSTILISKLQLCRNDMGDISSVQWQKLRPPANMSMPAGGTWYRDGMVFCSQGTSDAGTGGLYHMPRGQPPVAVVTNYFGRDFNSVRHVAVAQDGSLWFTDPRDGYHNGLRPEPKLPCHVYRYDPTTGDLRVVADGLVRPHGIAFSPDKSTLYVLDAKAIGDDGTPREMLNATTIYAFDVVERHGSPFLANRRVFACVVSGIPSSIMCDRHGNVYAGCEDGVQIWNPAGSVLGMIEAPGPVTSFSFGFDNELFLCEQQRLWLLDLGEIPEE